MVIERQPHTVNGKRIGTFYGTVANRDLSR